MSNGVHILYSSVVCMKGHQSPSMYNIIDLFIYTQFLCLLPHPFGSKSLIFISILRFILVPLLVLCVTPSPTHPIFSPPFNLVVSTITVTVIGATNGYFGTLGMQQGPTMVPSVEKELAGETRIQHIGSLHFDSHIFLCPLLIHRWYHDSYGVGWFICWIHNGLRMDTSHVTGHIHTLFQ